MEKIIIFFLGVVFFSLSVKADFLPDNISEIQKYYHTGDKKKSIAALKESISKNKDKSLLSLLYFALGKVYFEIGDDKESQKYLAKSLSLSKKYQDHIYFLNAKSLLRQGEESLAADKLVKIMHLKPRSHLYKEARFEFAKISYNQKKYKKAWQHFRYLARRMRSDKVYPEILWYYMLTDIKRGRTWHACRWARKLYSKFPDHSLVNHWNIFLDESKVNDRKLRCTASLDTKKKRLRNLKLSGNLKRAQSEMEYFLSKEKDMFVKIYLQASLQIYQGLPDMALKTLLPHFDQYTKSYKYLHLVAKAAASAGEYSVAVNAYYKAHKLVPRSRKGRFSLFQAAFLSYTFKDYDGAARKFKQFIKKYRRSGLSKDARWHLAWIRYLKKDYQGAYLQFKKLRRTYRRFRRQDRVLYWQAMSALRLNQNEEAAKAFSKLANRKWISYYTIASRQRLQSIRDMSSERKVASRLSVEDLGEEDKLIVDKNLDHVKEEQESEDTLSQLEKIEEEKNSEDKIAEDLEAGEIDEEESEKELPTLMAPNEKKSLSGPSLADVKRSFKNPYLRKRFIRAQEFKHLGFWDLAKWELYAIERKTRKRNYLRKLMSEYMAIGAYHRVAQIAQNSFFSERSKYGVEGARYLWEYTYPKPFFTSVEKANDEFDVAKELIWSIMRAESRYRPDARSPVGAMGLMQMMPYTGEHIAKLIDYEAFSAEDLFKPQLNIRFGSRYLQRLSKKFSAKIPLIAAGYNAGPHRVDGWVSKFGNRLEMDEFIEHIPYVETRKYVKKVVRNLDAYRQIYKSENLTAVALSQQINLKINATSFSREDWKTKY